jgi:hypothetical protein
MEAIMKPKRIVLGVAIFALLNGLDRAHSADKVLVPGNPPLTQGMLDLDIAAAELLLDSRFTDAQRREYCDIVIEDWKGFLTVEKRQRVQNLDGWGKLPTWSNYRRNEVRAFNQAKFRAARAKDKSGASRWLVALDAETSKPGSKRNPVLVDAKPQLTQLLVDGYTDYLEIMIDLSASGGFTPLQRRTLQHYVVKDWKKMSDDDRKELLTDLERWTEAAGLGSAEANKAVPALRPKVLAQLLSERGSPRADWLLEVCHQERELHERKLAMEKLRHEGVKQALDAMPFYKGGHWEKDAPTGKYIRWVPNR